jgi:hypothetical protein
MRITGIFSLAEKTVTVAMAGAEATVEEGVSSRPQVVGSCLHSVDGMGPPPTHEHRGVSIRK